MHVCKYAILTMIGVRDKDITLRCVAVRLAPLGLRVNVTTRSLIQSLVSHCSPTIGTTGRFVLLYRIERTVGTFIRF